jgi:uncharacterized repeat protein (TIGR01451 family)
LTRRAAKADSGAERGKRPVRGAFLVLGALAVVACAAAVGAFAFSGGYGNAAASEQAAGSGGLADSADLELTKSDSPDPVATGAALTYTIEVKNNGPDTATAVEVSDKLPSGVDFVSVSASTGTCKRMGRNVTCELGDLANGAARTVTIQVRPKKAGQIENTASVESTVADPKGDNDEDTETTTVQEGPAAPTCKGKAATLIGTAGDDRGAGALIGTSRRDVILALAGNDEVSGRGGKDLICAGPGDDEVKGGAKADQAFGGGGRDRLNGGGGGDALGGQGGADKLIGGNGADTLRGNRGRDRLRGNRGPDLLVGGPNRDRCNGGPGRDTLRSC